MSRPDVGSGGRTITVAELAKHNKPHASPPDMWIAVDGKVYDVSTFDHPGGVEEFHGVAGKDASIDFAGIGHSADANPLMKEIYVGELEDVPKSSSKSGISTTVKVVSAVVAVVAIFWVYKDWNRN